MGRSMTVDGEYEVLDNDGNKRSMLKRMLKHLGRKRNKILPWLALLLGLVLVGGTYLYTQGRNRNGQNDVAWGAANNECVAVVRMEGICRIEDRYDYHHPDQSTSVVFIVYVDYPRVDQQMGEEGASAIYGTLTVEVDSEGLVWAIH